MQHQFYLFEALQNIEPTIRDFIFLLGTITQKYTFIPRQKLRPKTAASVDLSIIDLLTVNFLRTGTPLAKLQCSWVQPPSMVSPFIFFYFANFQLFLFTIYIC